MQMIKTPAPVLPAAFSQYAHNCLRNAACEPAFFVPIPGVPYLQFYVDFGTTAPISVEFQIIDYCTGTTEQIFPSNYVAGQTPEGNYYGVFKYFNTPILTGRTFAVWLSAMVLNGLAVEEKTFFSELYDVDPCGQLTKIKACQPAGALATGFDINGIYYGLPTNEDFLGLESIRYFHIAYVRLAKVKEISNKATFRSSFVANFRTVVEKIHRLESEIIPKFYKNVLLAIFSRGAIQVGDDGKTWLLSELEFEGVADDDLTWKPFVLLKETFRLYFGCDDSQCVECCSPQIISAAATIQGADNRIEIEFTPCEPTPSNGYRISYRPIGGGAYRVANVLASPAVIVDENDPPGTSYEGYITGDCGGNQFGAQVPFTAPNEDAPSDSPDVSASASASASASEPPPPDPEGTIIINVNSGITLNFLSGITHDVGMPISGGSDSGTWTGFTGGAMAINVDSPGGGSWQVAYNGVFQASTTFPAGSGVASPIAGLAAPPNGTTIEISVLI